MSGTFSYEHVVTFADTHLMGSVYFVNYLAWQGRCRELFLTEHAPGVVGQVRSGTLILVTLSCSCEYLAELRAMDRVRIEMSLTALNGNRLEMWFDYYRVATGSCQNELVARGRHATACLRSNGNQLEPTSVPDELADAIRALGT